VPAASWVAVLPHALPCRRQSCCDLGTAAEGADVAAVVCGPATYAVQIVLVNIPALLLLLLLLSLVVLLLLLLQGVLVRAWNFQPSATQPLPLLMLRAVSALQACSTTLVL
jgi:hypothetical protein